MYRIEILQSASDNIDDIGRYIAAELKNKTAAERLTEKIYSAIEPLAAFPYAHPVHQTPQNEEPLKHEYRKILVDNYFVFYHVDERIRIKRKPRNNYRVKAAKFKANSILVFIFN